MWADKPIARRHWSDASTIADDKLDELLEAAWPAVFAYAPALAEDAEVPTHYKLAQVYQAREVWAAAQRGESDVIGVGDFALRARPLTAAVKQLLRPQRGVPKAG